MLQYVLAIVLAPRKAFESLLADRRRLAYGSRVMILVAFLCALGILLVALGGHKPQGLKPWLSIQRNVYYYWESVFIAPVMVLGWILAAGVIQSLARCAGSKGSFEDVLALLGYGIAVPTIVILIPKFVEGFLTLTRLVDVGTMSQLAAARQGPYGFFLWTVASLYALGLVALVPRVVSVVHRIRGLKAFTVGIVGVVIYQTVLFVFKR